MSARHIILDCLPSLCQKLSDLVEVFCSYDKNNFACFSETLCSLVGVIRHTTQSDNFSPQVNMHILITRVSRTTCPQSADNTIQVHNSSFVNYLNFSVF